MKKTIYITLICVMFSLTVHAEQKVERLTNGQFFFPEHNLAINVEIAKSKKQRALGLMYREQLAANKGMLFVFEDEDIKRVWMKNTLIPLDIIFISEEGSIVSIFKNIQPCQQNPCAIYNSGHKVKYMLEVNAGFVADNNIVAAEKVWFNLF